MSIQELIEKWTARTESNRRVIDAHSLSNWQLERLGEANGFYEDFIKDLQALQSEHKAEIEDAYEAGKVDGGYVLPASWEYESAEDYYQKTFTPEKFKK